jgi:hypothetical protein
MQGLSMPESRFAVLPHVLGGALDIMIEWHSSRFYKSRSNFTPYDEPFSFNCLQTRDVDLCSNLNAVAAKLSYLRHTVQEPCDFCIRYGSK